MPRLGTMTTKPDTDHRHRLLNGLAMALETKRYRDITLADIAAAARVSRRTFYEQFDSKDACLLALADQTSDAIMAAVMTSAEGNKTWPTLVRDITHTYLRLISTRPQLMRALYIEMAALGEEGVQMRRTVAERFAVFLRDQVEQHREKGESLEPLSLPMSMALVAGINELILYALSEREAQDPMTLAPAAEALIQRVTECKSVS